MVEFERQRRRIIAIAGAGIAGLTAALTLANVGFRVVVLEKQDSLPTSGAGIQLSPNATRILQDIELSRALRAISTAPEAIEIYRGIDGKQVSEFLLGAEMRDRYQAPYLTISRGELTAALEAACQSHGDIDIRYGYPVTDIAVHQNGVTLLAGKGHQAEEVQAIAAIGADGVWSLLRNSVPTATSPTFSGHIAWRGILPMELVPPEFSRSATGLWLGPKAHLVTYPLKGGTTMNVVAITPWMGEEAPPKGWIAEDAEDQRIEPFDTWQMPVRALVRQPISWGGWPIYAFSKPERSNYGPLCLIGDASHAMLPYAAQGGASAIEDAAVLAKCCKAHSSDMPTAFEAFWKIRRQRLRHIINTSRSNRAIYHMGALESIPRDLFMKYAPQSWLQGRMTKIYGWTVDPK